jgi:hypothetical protein
MKSERLVSEMPGALTGEEDLHVAVVSKGFHYKLPLLNLGSPMVFLLN